MMAKKATTVICIKCKHYRHQPQRMASLPPSSGPSDSGIWYNHRCGHPSSLQKRFDYTIGRDESEQAFCRDINPSGGCKLYEAKK